MIESGFPGFDARVPAAPSGRARTAPKASQAAGPAPKPTTAATSPWHADPLQPHEPAGAAPARSPRRTQAERREEAERRLLEAALGVVARRGSVRMTLAEVGEAAGYSRGLPAQRFGSKAGLLRALAVYIGECFRLQREADGQRTPGLDAIRGSIDVYFSRTEPAWPATRALLVMMTEGFMEGSDLRENVMAYNRSALSFFEHHIRIGIEGGEIPPDTDPRTTAVMLLGTMRGVMLQWLIDPEIDLAKVRDRLLAVVDQVLRRR